MRLTTFKQVSVPLISNEKLSYADMITKLNTYDEIEDLGVCSDGVNHLYGISIGDTTKPTIYINSGIHGHEWQAVYGVIHFMDCLVNPNNLIENNDEVKDYFEVLISKYHFYATPMLNPSGWIADTRDASVGADLNRQYMTTGTYPEIDALKAKVAVLKPWLFTDNHTSQYDYESVGVGGLGNINYEVLAENILKCTKYIRGHEKVLWYQVDPIQKDRTIGRGWASEQISSSGRSTLSILTESARQGTLGTLQNMADYTFNSLLMTCVLADRYFTKGILV